VSIYQYNIIAKDSESIYVIKKSKFIAKAFHISSIDNVQDQLNQIRKAHPKAGHHCYAYRLGIDKNQYRANDDGEPSGTAGRPILGQIDSKELTDTLVVVTRYFGGIKLGASGLISAYKTAAKQVLDISEIRTKKITKDVRIGSDHQHINIIMSLAKKIGFEIVSIEYDPRPAVILRAPLEDLSSNLDILKSRTLNMSIDQARETDAKDVFHIFDPE